MKKIPLTKNKFALVDDDDYDFLVGMGSWQAIRRGKTDYYYAVHNTHKHIDGKRKNYSITMHKVVLSEAKRIDHINGDGLDNRKSNLRECTQSQNMMNANMRKSNTSGFKGVTFRKDKKKRPYVARLYLNGQTIYLGHYDEAEQAAVAYNTAAVQYFGEFALLNKLGEVV